MREEVAQAILEYENPFVESVDRKKKGMKNMDAHQKGYISMHVMLFNVDTYLNIKDI